MKIYPSDRLLSVIPLAHTYECVLGMITAVMSGASVTYLDKPPSPAVLLPAMQVLRPTAMVTVPLFIEKICRLKIFPEMEKSRFFKFRLTRPLVRFLAGQKLLSSLGSAIRFFGIGGAPLADDVELFLRQVKFPYSTGYGLTETAPIISGTRPYLSPFRSSGLVLEGSEVRISNAGEIEVRGPNVMLGYYRDEKRTRESFTEDGWFKTGDLGRLDRKGFLYIYGRLKAMILGPSGENIYPEEIESLLCTSSLVEEALVFSGEKGELAAMVKLSEAGVKEASTEPAKMLEELRAWTNNQLADFSRLSRIEIRHEPFEKTPTMKIKRHLYV
jgi:long-chain acyl-CoA synthetase